jgi:hypothetical protein
MPNTWSDPYAQTGAGPSYKTSRANNASEQVLGLYQSNFGRSAAPAEVEGWIKHVGGGSYLSPDQLNTIQGEFKKAPEYASYTGTRPTVQAGDYIPGVTLGTRLDQDEALRTRANFGGGLTVNPEQPSTTAAEQETTNLGVQQQIRERLLGLLDPQTPSPNDPALQPAISAFNQAQNRSTARTVAANAEAFGASGLESSGARLAADRGAIEQQGLNEGQFAGNLMLQELEGQRQRAQAGLQMALAMNDQDLSRRLQEKLGMLQATIQREGLAQQGKLAQSDIDLRQKLGMGNLNLGLLGLAQQGRQFNDSLGFNISQAQIQANRDAVIAMLGGL